MPTTHLLTPGIWTLDPTHSGVYFKVRHLGLTNVRGRFNGVDAWLTVGEDLASTHFGATIDITSVDTNQADRDAHLRSTDFFSADEHPTMTFESSSIEEVGGGEYEAEGKLTINGITQPVRLAIEFGGTEVFPVDGSVRAGFVATTRIVRDDFGIDFNLPLGMDKFALGKRIDIEIDVEFVAPEAG
jgi:polyisoprenoid-binding protein YceI